MSATVLLSGILASPAFASEQRRSPLSFALGVSVDGQPIVASMLSLAGPDQVRVLLVDPKMTELLAYEDVPHLVTTVVRSALEAATALHWAVAEMKRRYRHLARFAVRSIDQYNRQLATGDLHLESGLAALGTGFYPRVRNFVATFRTDLGKAHKQLLGFCPRKRAPASPAHRYACLPGRAVFLAPRRRSGPQCRREAH